MYFKLGLKSKLFRRTPGLSLQADMVGHTGAGEGGFVPRDSVGTGSHAGDQSLRGIRRRGSGVRKQLKAPRLTSCFYVMFLECSPC
jgi:hypothetical protein